MYDLIIVGGGPAGLAAAAYALGRQLQTALVYTELGGQVGWHRTLADVEEERQLPGAEVLRLLQREISGGEGALIQDHVLAVTEHGDGFEVRTAQQGVLAGRAVVIATGAAPLRLHVEGAQRLVHHGLGYSIRTYAHLVAGKRVAVIGVTPRSLRGAAELAQVARQVYLLAPGPAGTAQPLIEALSRRPNLTVLADYEVTAVIGDTTLRQLRIARDGETRQLDVEQAFVDLGLVPNSAAVQQLVGVDARGFVLVDRFNATTVPGIFAAGDVTNTPGEQVLVAVGDGARAAMSAYDYLLARWLAEGATAWS